MEAKFNDSISENDELLVLHAGKGFKPLSYELIKLFRSGAPDFSKAEELIRQGADVNDQNKRKTKNVLSAILIGYWESGTADGSLEVCYECEESSVPCTECKHFLNPNPGEAMIKVIKFFFEKGFDVTKNGDRFGRQCILALLYSTFDIYSVEAMKMIYRAYGGKNPKWFKYDNHGSVIDCLLEVRDYENVAGDDFSLAQRYEAMCQIYYAIEDDIPYAGISSFEAAIGKKIIRVMAEKRDDKEVIFSVSQMDVTYDNCFDDNLYFIFDGGYLTFSCTPLCWVDNNLPDSSLVDVSEKFVPIINSTIQDIICEKPNISLMFDNNEQLNITDNYWKVQNENYCTYFYYGERKR